MNKSLSLVIVCFFQLFTVSYAYAYFLGYTDNNDVIHIWNSDNGQNVTVPIKSWDFSVSHDGKYVCAVMNSIDSGDVWIGSKRYLIVYDVRKRTTTRLNIPINQCYNPLWNEAGTMIAFDYLPPLKDATWTVAFYDLINSRLIKSDMKDTDLCSWVDSISVLAMPDSCIIRMDTAGHIISTFCPRKTSIALGKGTTELTFTMDRGEALYYDPSKDTYYLSGYEFSDDSCFQDPYVIPYLCSFDAKTGKYDILAREYEPIAQFALDYSCKEILFEAVNSSCKSSYYRYDIGTSTAKLLPFEDVKTIRLERFR